MASKKTTLQNSDGEKIDIIQIAENWWQYRKLIFLGTIILSLLTAFTLYLFNQTIIQKNQKYITATVQGDMGDNSVIIAALKSPEYIKKTLKQVSLEIDQFKLLDNMFVLKSTDPLTDNLQQRISSLTINDIKKLSLSNKDLVEIVESFENTSKNLITIKLYHLPLGLSEYQAKNFILALTNRVNKQILLRTNRTNLGLQIINVASLDELTSNLEKITHLSNVISIIQNNINNLKDNHQEQLFNVDFSSMITSVNIAQKILFEISSMAGNQIAIKTIDLTIDNLKRDINDLSQSLKFINTNISKDNRDNNQNDIEKNSTNNNTQLDGEVFDKILSIGSVLELNNFKLETLTKIQNLQQESNKLIKQKNQLKLPFTIESAYLNYDHVSERIKVLSIDVNNAISQIRSLTQPKNALEFVRNPELIDLSLKSLKEFLKSVVILSMIGFLILSIFVSFLPKKKTR